MAKQGIRPGQGGDKRADNAHKQDTDLDKARTKPPQGAREAAPRRGHAGHTDPG